jgi:hypothetical protein
MIVFSLLPIGAIITKTMAITDHSQQVEILQSVQKTIQANTKTLKLVIARAIVDAPKIMLTIGKNSNTISISTIRFLFGGAHLSIPGVSITPTAEQKLLNIHNNFINTGRIPDMLSVAVVEKDITHSVNTGYGVSIYLKIKSGHEIRAETVNGESFGTRLTVTGNFEVYVLGLTLEINRIVYDTSVSPMTAKWTISGTGYFAGLTFDIEERMGAVEVEKGPLPTGNEIQYYMEALTSDLNTNRLITESVPHIIMTIHEQSIFGVKYSQTKFDMKYNGETKTLEVATL